MIRLGPNCFAGEGSLVADATGLEDVDNVEMADGGLESPNGQDQHGVLLNEEDNDLEL